MPGNLRGQGENRHIAVQRLTDTLVSNAGIPMLVSNAGIHGLVMSILEEPTERFPPCCRCNFAKLTTLIEVNKRSYSEVSLVDNHVDPSISPEFMGMGSG